MSIEQFLDAELSKLNSLSERLSNNFGDKIIFNEIKNNEFTIIIEPQNLVNILSHLQNIEGFSTLIDICGVDYPNKVLRFEVVYHLLSMNNNIRIRVKTQIKDGGVVPSIVDLWPVANWYEREAFDMYGILFDNHPDLRRILTDYGFEGYPLRKDFPLTGYQEVRYDEEKMRVVYEPVKLVQEFRNFDFLSPWEGMLPGDEKAKTEVNK